jgi:uncharacterized protein YkvS
MNGMKKLIVTTIREYLNENKITPDYLKINKPYIDKDGNLIGSDTYKVNDYEKYDFISDKAHSFLINWCWNETNLRFYQTHGLNAIHDEIIDELSQWKPKSPIKLYRAVCDKDGEMKYKNKLKSYFKTLEAAQMTLEDVYCQSKGGYVQTIKANPEDILVDMTLIPNWRDLDIIDEVIVITND